MPAREVQSSLPIGNIKNFKWDFLSDLAVGETITGVPTVTMNVYSGADATPQTMVNGAATVSGSVVTQSINSKTAGVLGVVYEAVCNIVTSLGQNLTHTSFIVVVPTSP